MEIRELLDLLLRWVHVVAAIMWVGNSLLFNWLDRNLRPRASAGDASRGEIWLLHSGGFYEIEKTVAPAAGLPKPLHWFKWQAYTTWLSGAALLIVVYYASGGALLLGATSPLSGGAAIAIGVGMIVLAVVAYETIWRGPVARSATLSTLGSLALLLAAAWWLTQVFSGRAAFLHVGAMLGTLMAANVAHVIVPSQRDMVAALERGEAPDPALSDRAKLRSIHNNYLTFPVIVLMLSSHFPVLYSAPASWLVLVLLLLLGAAVRHILNVRFTFARWVPVLVATIMAGAAAIWIAASWRPQTEQSPIILEPDAQGRQPETVSFEHAERIVHKRCTVCHSASPADRTFGIAPGGVVFDTPDQIRALAPRILARAVETRTMPPANRTGMTEEERAVLGLWAERER